MKPTKADMRDRLSSDTKEAVSKLSEYALKNPHFNYSVVKNECDFAIKTLAVKEKTEQA